ncbi:MAG: ELM1/GtrOC1 family putative glycosyltransferase, partial [Proteobacteria bacterium]|nr:ELM1/GtrOC1 family putative glycosyltransferase [Pseudomonadota bacterium]
ATTFAIHNIKFEKNKNKNKKNTINFIIGGKNKNFKFDKTVQEKILNDIKILSQKYFVQIIPSRRTPERLIEKIKNKKIPNSDILISINNPIKYGQFLCQSIANIVTWDSISMISESVYSGVGTFIYSFEKESLPKKYKYFHRDLMEKNYIKNFSINFTPFKTTINEDLSELKNNILYKINQSPIFNT